MMQQWADHLDELRAKDGKVVAIGQGRKVIGDRPKARTATIG